ncbi:MAG: hypothetical protein H6709_16590 [Kofleriaceae bacterium]|nr:hypothetical protein [Myxococcales bacterium]MCB9561751.1 hypothetical protein [Kofleriaceae bacterium]MCB9573700.1 hypothetical protein [Kofleriaceae bacterium]
MAVALRARLVARSLSPLLPSLRVGALLRWRRAAWGIDADPHLQLGLYHRDLGNRAQLDLPLWVRFALGCRVAGWVRSGVRGELAVVADDLSIPLGLGAAARLGPVDVGVEGAFVRLLGPLNNVAERDLVLFARWRRD